MASMDIRALVKRIRARIRGRLSHGRHGPGPRSGLQAWEAFDKASFDDMVDEISYKAEEDAEQLTEALRNLN